MARQPFGVTSVQVRATTEFIARRSRCADSGRVQADPNSQSACAGRPLTDSGRVQADPRREESVAPRGQLILTLLMLSPSSSAWTPSIGPSSRFILLGRVDVSRRGENPLPTCARKLAPPTVNTTIHGHKKLHTIVTHFIPPAQTYETSTRPSVLTHKYTAVFDRMFGVMFLLKPSFSPSFSVAN